MQPEVIHFDGGHARAMLFESREPGARSGVVVIHETWGLDEQLMRQCRHLASLGHRVIAPDLLWMNEQIPESVLIDASRKVYERVPRAEWRVPGRAHTALHDVDPVYREAVSEWLAHSLAGPTEQGHNALAACVKRLRDWGCEKVALLGFCFGGAYVWACDAKPIGADAHVVFYGHPSVSTEPGAPPILVHHGADDAHISLDAVERSIAHARVVGVSASLEIYPGAGHAFMNDTRDTWLESAANTAWKRTETFLRETFAT